MHIFRATNPQAIDLIKDYLVIDDDLTCEEVVDLLRGQMMQFPEDTQVTLLVEDETVRAFSVSFVPAQRRHLYVFQAWSELGLPAKWSKMFFTRMVTFAKERGLDEIRMETRRSPQAFTKKYGFKPISMIMSFRLKEGDQDGDDDRRRPGLHVNYDSQAEDAI